MREPIVFVTMTALPPTRGHQYLIDWARQFRDAGGFSKVVIFLSTMPSEPMPGEERHETLVARYGHDERVKVIWHHQELPKEPEDHPDFWSIWKEAINYRIKIQPDDVVVASELYGAPLAKVLGCEFVPCDLERGANQISASAFRQDPIQNFWMLMPEARRYFRRTITFFGAESTGKTTCSIRLAARLKTQWVPEWARGYLNSVGAEITPEKMARIAQGQAATQNSVQFMSDDPVIIQDTDLITTIGYHNLWGIETPKSLTRDAAMLKSDLYIVMPDTAPFEADAQRYGGDHRETDAEYWRKMLWLRGCNYHMMESKGPWAQVEEAEFVVRKCMADAAAVIGFKRNDRG